MRHDVHHPRPTLVTLALDTEVEMSGKATVALGEDGSVVILEPSDSQ